MEQKRRRDDREKGFIFIVSAPSGTGKTTLCRKVVEELPNLRFSVSHTTRFPRANELEGEDYYFITPNVFQEMVKRNEFLEWAEVLGNRYGTARSHVEDLIAEGVDLILDIDTQGAKKVQEKMDEVVLIYLLPPSMEALKERLVNRGLDSFDMIQFRLAHAKRDLEEAYWYQYVIVNEKIEDAAEKLKAIIIAEKCRRNKNSILDGKIKELEENRGKNYSGRLSKKGGEPV